MAMAVSLNDVSPLPLGSVRVGRVVVRQPLRLSSKKLTALIEWQPKYLAATLWLQRHVARKHQDINGIAFG